LDYDTITFPKFDPPPVAFGVQAGGAWDSALIDIVTSLNSDTNKRRTFYVDNKIAVVYDPYAKAKVHLLCIMRSNIDGPTNLKAEHVELLEHAHEIASRIVPHLKKQLPTLDFQIGYHAIPSMKRLHFHIISNDFISVSIKNKKHWNSFTTEFFLSCDHILNELKTKGKITIDKKKYEEILKKDLQCHRCHIPQKNIPKLKEHIEKCKK
jgi:aprataxin